MLLGKRVSETANPPNLTPLTREEIAGYGEHCQIDLYLAQFDRLLSAMGYSKALSWPEGARHQTELVRLFAREAPNLLLTLVSRNRAPVTELEALQLIYTLRGSVERALPPIANVQRIDVMSSAASLRLMLRFQSQAREKRAPGSAKTISV